MRRSYKEEVIKLIYINFFYINGNSQVFKKMSSTNKENNKTKPVEENPIPIVTQETKINKALLTSNETTTQELNEMKKAFLENYSIIETLMESPEEGYQEVHILKNGDAVRDQYYQSYVKHLTDTFISNLINEGFQDSEGNIWGVARQITPALSNPIDNLYLTGAFNGQTQFHRYLKKLKAHTQASRYFQDEVMSYVHTTEEYFLSGVSPEIASEFEKLKQTVVMEELQEKIEMFRMDYTITNILAGERDFDREYGYFTHRIYVLKKGIEVEEEIYLARINREVRHFWAQLHNQGFTDSTGKCWSVEGEIEETNQNIPSINLRITGIFPGETALHQLIEKMKEIEDVPLCFQYEIDQHIHQSEEKLMTEVSAYIKDTFQMLKGIIHPVEEA